MDLEVLIGTRHLVLLNVHLSRLERIDDLFDVREVVEHVKREFVADDALLPVLALAVVRHVEPQGVDDEPLFVHAAVERRSERNRDDAPVLRAPGSGGFLGLALTLDAAGHEAQNDVVVHRPVHRSPRHDRVFRIDEGDARAGRRVSDCKRG